MAGTDTIPADAGHAMKKLRYVPQDVFAQMGRCQQLGYLLRCRQAIEQGNCVNMPCWLYWVTLAYFTENVEEIQGTYTMSIYEDVLINQVLE